ncbi:DDE-type integrase/transposase/recombinase [Nitrosopumilus sp.]|uniref:DDE-type integrase/transposase/recombinase n=1 Tax=Nitrosopumilus sp. TaxID=2024843 RepID=UPI00260B6DD5|nr:DDE-type integrase/transposase/recombinase [Nitrosopumilus sp.]
MELNNKRQEKGKKIAEKQDQITRIDEDHYLVKSQSNNKQYDVIATENGWTCTCPDHCFRQVCCKHIHAVEVSLEIRKTVKEQVTINEIQNNSCPKCHSTNIKKDGIRHNKNYDIQRFKCRDCNKKFSINLGFEKMKASPQIITSALQLYFTGESLRNTQKFLELQGVKVTHKTVWNWIRKYTNLMEKYLEKITPQVSDKWRTDELYLRIKGDRKYLFAMMDDETRFWIAKQVSTHKNTDDVRPMFRESVKVAGKKPKVLISDGAKNFAQAHTKEWYSRYKKDQSIHIRHVHFKNDMNNNKMERLNGEIRDREKIMRGLKKEDTPILSGYQIYHNYVRSHMGLDGKTPAEACGIKIAGKNKWKTLIQNASQS